MKIQREHIGNYSYEVGINSVADYSPFGVELDGRTIDNIFHHPSQNNGSQTQADTVEIYNNDFDNPPATASPYYSTKVTLDAHLSNTTWTSSTGAFTNYNSSGAGSGKSIAITTASADTAYLTLTMDVANGFELDITSYSFAHRSSATGYNSYTLIVNGIEIGSGSIYVASSGSTLQSTGVVDVSNPISGQTGTVGVVLKLYGGTHGHSGTFRMDDFVLNGFVREENSGHSSSDYFVSRNHRYSFQNQEKHDEIRGKGNYINYKYRGHDPRVGRLDWLVDPLSPEYPWNSPYAFSENRVLDGVELEGLEFVTSDDLQRIEVTIYVHNKSEVIRDVESYFSENITDAVNTFFSDENTTYNFNFIPITRDNSSEYIEQMDVTIRLNLVDNKMQGNSYKGGEAPVGKTYGAVFNLSVGLIIPNGMIEETVLIEIEKVINALIHELGHLQGLKHIWEETIEDAKQPEYEEIEYNRKAKNQVRSNFMNSSDNTEENGGHEDLAPKTSAGQRTKTEGQSRKMKETVINNHQKQTKQ